MPTPLGSTVTLRVALQLPQRLLDTLEAQGPLETVIAAHLNLVAQYNLDGKPLVIEDAERKDLERMLGKNLKSVEALLAEVRRLTTVKLGEVEVHLEPLLLERLKSRCFGKPFEQYLQDLSREELERYVGMR